MRSVCTLVSSCLLLMAATAVSAAPQPWVRSWGAAPLPPAPAMGPFPASPGFADQTIRQVVRLSAGGTRIQVRLTNEYGAGPLVIGAAHIAAAGPDGAITSGSDHVLTFGGKPDAVIPAGSPLVSDPVDMATAPLARLSISVYLPKATGPCTCHATAMQTGYVAAGDQTGAPSLASATQIQTRAFISAVEASGAAPAKTVIVLGDSISDGVGSTANADHRWPDRLAERLLARGLVRGVSNQGISGNRVLADGAGVSALARFDRDVLSTPGAAYVIVFEGINDIGIAYMRPPPDGPLAAWFKQMAGGSVTAQDLISGYRQMIARAHGHGLKIYGATITPYEGAATFTPEGEAVRQAVNAWIRSGNAFDAVLDFDAVIRDPQHPAQMQAAFHAGDHLHGSDDGYKVLVDSINLKLFQ